MPVEQARDVEYDVLKPFAFGVNVWSDRGIVYCCANLGQLFI